MNTCGSELMHLFIQQIFECPGHTSILVLVWGCRDGVASQIISEWYRKSTAL